MAGFYSCGSQAHESVEAIRDAAYGYLCSGNLYAAYRCMESLSEDSLAVVYNKALCLFLADGLEECYRLLDGTGRLSVSNVSGKNELHIPDVLRRWEFDSGPHLTPAPWGAPDDIVACQMLLLKAEVAYRLRIYQEVKRLSAALGGKYRHLKEIAGNI